jgi:hypothetical protein
MILNALFPSLVSVSPFAQDERLSETNLVVIQ